MLANVMVLHDLSMAGSFFCLGVSTQGKEGGGEGGGRLVQKSILFYQIVRRARGKYIITFRTKKKKKTVFFLPSITSIHK